MEVIICENPEEVVVRGFQTVKKQVERLTEPVLGLATGATMEPLYALMRGLDLSASTTFNLDEYVGLGPDHPCSYAAYMEKHLFSHTKVRKFHLLNGLTEDIPQHCQDYEQAIKEAGGLDLQLLGIGSDGHIAFNEPGSSLSSRTRLKILTSMTREANSKHFPPGEDVPKYVLTMGVGTVMEARHCLLLAYGQSKARAVAGAIEGGVSAFCPASILQMHPRCTMIVDEAAASLLKLKDYYRNVYENKPEWMNSQ